MLTRRSFLRSLGIGAGVAIAAPSLLLPEARRVWQVPANAPVPLRDPHKALIAVPKVSKLSQLQRLACVAAAKGETQGGTILVSPQTYEDICAEIDELRRFDITHVYDPNAIVQPLKMNTVAGAFVIAPSMFMKEGQGVMWPNSRVWDEQPIAFAGLLSTRRPRFEQLATNDGNGADEWLRFRTSEMRSRC